MSNSGGRYVSSNPEESQVACFEREFRDAWGGGMRFAIAVNSCSSAILLVLRALGVGPGHKVLTPAFTFTAVPSAVVNLGAMPILIESTMDFKVDMDDLREKAVANPEAKVLLLSHMRGWISDMDAIVAFCKEHDLILVEDSAHALGSRWNGQLVGTFGIAACYSFQSYKIVHPGEGGMIVTDDEDLAARVIISHGAYEDLYTRHLVGPPEEVIRKYLNRLPLYNMRMPEQIAMEARQQLPRVEEEKRRYAKVYKEVVDGLLIAADFIDIPRASPLEDRVTDSIQFRLRGFSPDMVDMLVSYVRLRRFNLAGIGTKDNARAPWNQLYIPGIKNLALSKTHAALDTACDMRLSTSMDAWAFTDAVIRGVHTVCLPHAVMD